MLTALLAAVSILIATGCAGGGGVSQAQPPKAAEHSTLVLAVTPSARALRLEMRHGMEIVDGVEATNLTLLGIYVQPIGVPRPQWLREPFIDGAVPEFSKLVLEDCNKEPTNFLRKKCEKRNADKLEKAQQTHATAVTNWKRKTQATLLQVQRGPTIEAPKNAWNIRGAFLEIGQNLSGLATPVRCVVLLGGLAVRNPPTKLRAELFKGTTVIVAGWRGTEIVRVKWENTLASAGGKVVIIPQAITDLKLVPTVQSCLNQP